MEKLLIIFMLLISTVTFGQIPKNVKGYAPFTQPIYDTILKVPMDTLQLSPKDSGSIALIKQPVMYKMYIWTGRKWIALEPETDNCNCQYCKEEKRIRSIDPDFYLPSTYPIGTGTIRIPNK